MKIIDREKITDTTIREILDTETHHDHVIIEDDNGSLRWKENSSTRQIVDKIGLNDIYQLFISLGLDKNSETWRQMYRDMGYSLFGYWEVFYFELNNKIASEYVPQKK